MTNETELHQFRRVRRFIRAGAMLWLTAQLLLTVLFAIGVTRSYGVWLNVLTVVTRAFQGGASIVRLFAMLGLSILYVYVLVRMIIGCVRNIRGMYILSLQKVEERYITVDHMNEQFGLSTALMLLMLFVAEGLHGHSVTVFGVAAVIMCAAVIFIGTIFGLLSHEDKPPLLFVLMFCVRVLIIFAILAIMGYALFSPRLERLVVGVETIFTNKWERLHDVVYMLYHYLLADVMWIAMTVIYVKMLFVVLNSVKCFEGHRPVPKYRYKIAHGTGELYPLLAPCLGVLIALIIAQWVVGIFFAGDSPMGILSAAYVAKYCLSSVSANEWCLLLSLLSGLMLFKVRFLPGDEKGFFDPRVPDPNDPED